MLIWQILAVVLILFFVVIAVLAFIEPGPLHRRSRERHPTPVEPDPPESDAR